MIAILYQLQCVISISVRRIIDVFQSETVNDNSRLLVVESYYSL